MDSDKSRLAIETPDLLAQLLAVLRYRWQILGVGFVFALLTALYVFSVDPIFRATVTVQIDPTLDRTVEVDDVYNPAVARDDYLRTQWEILKSRDMAAEVVDRLNLIDHPEFEDFTAPQPSLLVRLADYLPLPEADTEGEGEIELDPQSIRLSIAKVFRQMVEVEPKWGTRLVNVHVSAKDPRLAMDAANALTDIYIESGFEAKLEATQRASSWLTGRLETVKRRLENAEKALQEFRERESLVNVGGSRGLAEGELTSNLERYRDARRKRTELSNIYSKIVEANGSVERLQEIPVLFRSDLVRDTKASYLTAKADRVAVRSRYGPKHPKRIAAEARYEETKEAYQRQLQNAADGIKAEYEIARSTERDMEKLVGLNRSEIQRLDRKTHELQVLEREVATQRELYDLFLTRFTETSTTGDYETTNARVIDPAILPRRPYRPRKMRSVILGFIGGLLFGFCLAVLRYLLDDTFRSPEVMENLTGLPVLGMVPEEPVLASKGKSVSLIHEDPNGGYAESIRSIRTGILLSEIDEKNRIIAISSALPEEGKSRLALNLAVAFGQMEKTLLLDADMRRPAVAKYLKLEKSSNGLTELVAGSATREECIQNHEKLGIDVLAGGRISPNPTELLASKKFHELMKELAKDYDRIIVDTAPVQAVSDTLLISRLAKVILSTRADSTRKGAVQGTVKLLRQADAGILGCVLNYVDRKRRYGEYYYGYTYYAAADST